MRMQTTAHLVVVTFSVMVALVPATIAKKYDGGEGTMQVIPSL